MRSPALIVILLPLAGPAQAQSVQVTGKLGYLSEWEVKAKVTEAVVAGKKEFSGPLTVRHIGICAPGHSVEMSGELRYHVIGWIRPRMKATIVIDGVECGFDAALSQGYEGALSCPQWRGVPLSLSVKPVE